MEDFIGYIRESKLHPEHNGDLEKLSLGGDLVRFAIYKESFISYPRMLDSKTQKCPDVTVTCFLPPESQRLLRSLIRAQAFRFLLLYSADVVLSAHPLYINQRTGLTVYSLVLQWLLRLLLLQPVLLV